MILWSKKLTTLISKIEGNASEEQLDKFIEAVDYHMIETHGFLDAMGRAEHEVPGKPFTSKALFYLCGPIDDDPDNWRILKAGPAEGGGEVSEANMISMMKTAAKNLGIKT